MMDLKKPFVLENCGCFYKIIANHKFRSEDLVRQLLKLSEYKVIDFCIQLIGDTDNNDEKLILDYSDIKDITHYTKIDDVDDIVNLIEHSDNEIYAYDFYIIFKVGDAD